MKKNRVIYVFLLVISCFLLESDYVYAKKIEAMECEYTDSYKQWLKLSEKERKNTLEPVRCKSSQSFFNAVGNSKFQETENSSKFDLRDYGYVTSVKNQENSGTCWTFATMASIESNLLMNGLATDDVDLSEAHLAFSAQNGSFDSLMRVNRTYDDGGQALISSAYLFNRMGPVYEEKLPFSTLLNGLNNNAALPTKETLKNSSSDFAVKSMTMYNSDQGTCSNYSVSQIKKYLVRNGAMYARMMFSLGSRSSLNLEKTSDNYYKIVSNTLNGEYYYYDGSNFSETDSNVVLSNANANHAVTIIGWDDTIDASNFSTKPSRNGAWIIKNSYGTNQLSSDKYIALGKDGYYYVSYDDINICTSISGFYDIDKTKTGNSYYYDEIGVDYAVSIKSDSILANVFEKRNSESEKLNSVAFFSGQAGKNYDILYSADGSLDNLKVIKTVTSTGVGYMTVDVVMDNIDIVNPKFAIGVSISANEPIYVYYNAGSSFYNMEVPNVVSYFSGDGKWLNLNNSQLGNLIAPIRAYTNNNDYTIKESKVDTAKDKVDVSYEYSNIEASDIAIGIFKEDDSKYINNLISSFEVKNDLANSKKVTIGINDNTLEGNYVLVTSAKASVITTKFSVYKSGDGLSFEKIKEDNSGNKDDNNNSGNDGDNELVIKENPKNSDVNIGESNIENPNTGNSIELVIFGILIISMMGIVTIVSIKKYSDN